MHRYILLGWSGPGYQIEVLLDYRPHWSGGISDFVDPNGEPQNWNRYVLGDGNRKRRRPDRRGIRKSAALIPNPLYPPHEKGHSLSRRPLAIYHFWQTDYSAGDRRSGNDAIHFSVAPTKREQHDVFIADFNGKRTCNLTYKNSHAMMACSITRPKK